MISLNHILQHEIKYTQHRRALIKELLTHLTNFMTLMDPKNVYNTLKKGQNIVPFIKEWVFMQKLAE
jgi:hypothetical protein